jgi:hypothetical protein
MGRADPLADLADTPSMEIQPDEKGLGKPGIQVGPASDKAVVEPPPHAGASWIW